MNFLIGLIVIIGLYIILIPYVLSFVFKSLLGFNVANISMKNPLCLINIILWIKLPIWGLEDLIISIPKINVEFHLKRLKAIIKCQKLQIFFVRKLFCMEPIQLINGAQQAEILTNFNKEISKILKEKFLNSFKMPYYTQVNKGQRQQGRLKIIFKAIVYFILVIILQFLQFRVEEGRISFVSQIPRKVLKFKNIKQTRETLILLQCLTEYAFVFPEISLRIDIKNNQEEEFHFHCDKPILQNFKRPEHNLIQGSNVTLNLTLPFTFSLEQSLKKLSVDIQAQHGKLTTNPQDFVQIIKLLQQILFEPGNKQQENQQVINEQQQQSPLHFKINLKINSIQLILKQLYEAQYDSHQTSEYLSNISQSKLCFNKISLRNMQFMIKQTFLYIQKIVNQHQFEPSNKSSNSLSGSVLVIPNLLIYSQGKSIEVRHKQVNAICSREQIALLGKLFRLLNSRVLRQQYSWKTYEGFTQTLQRYYEGQLNLLETLIQIGNQSKDKKQVPIIRLAQNSRPKSKLNSFDGLLKLKKTIRYNPQNVNIVLRLNSLTHSITLSNSSYIRQSISTDITHTLRFPKIVIEHQQTKEFAIKQFKLIFQQASTIEQLSIFIDDIVMYQNYYTLLDYLVGFTVFKQLIQVDMTEDLENREEGRSLQSLGKHTKKIVNITEIALNYGQQKGIVRQIQINKEVSPNGYLEHLNFSIGKCQILVNNIVQTNKKHKYALSDKHTIFTLSSITMKMVLVELSSNSKGENSSKSHKKLKQRTLIHVKSPTIVLPQIVLAERLNSYIQTIFKLEIYFEAYLLNITDDKLRMIRKKMTNLIQQPNITIVKITDINLAMQQGFFDVAMLNYGRIIRQYFSKDKIYNQIEIINQLSQTKRTYKLCDIRVASLTLQHHPIKDLEESQYSVEKHLEQLFKQQFNSSKNSRLSKVFANYIKVSLLDLSLRIRDYPMNILKINQIGLKGQLLKTINIYSQQRYYVHGQFKLGQIQLSIGLNLLSGLYEIYKTFNTYYQAIQKHTKTEKWINQFQQTRKQQDKEVNISTKKNILADTTILQEDVFYPYWHILHKFSTWNLSMSKSSKTKINILTGSTPYSLQSLNLSIQSFKIHSKLQRSQLSIEKVKLFLHQYEIMTLNHLGGVFQSIYTEPRLNLIFNFHIGHQVPNHKTQNRLILSQKFIEYISQMKQLRYDWLLIYGLTASQDDNIRSNKLTDRMNYLQIANIAANKTLSKSKKKLSLMSVLNTLEWKFQLTDLTLLLTNQKHSIEGLLDNFQIYVKIAADRQGQEWKLYRLRANFKNAIARIQDQDTKQRQKQESYETFFLQQFRKITEMTLGNERQDLSFTQFKNVILSCKGVKYSYCSYHVTPLATYFVDNMFVVDQIRAQVSKQLKEVVLDLAKSLQIEKKLRIPQRNIKKAQSSLQRFRRAAKYIIRINKSKKQLPNLQFVVKVNHASLSLRTDKLQMVVTSDKQCSLTFNQKYQQADKFQIDPIHEVHILFIDLQIYLQKTDVKWMLMLIKENKLDRTRVVTARDLKLDAQVFANDQMPVYLFKDARIYETISQRINRTSCIFRQGIVELTPQTSNLLKSIAEFVLIMTNSKGRQLQNYKIESDKYSQLKAKGKLNIKNKLQWNYSDVMKEQKKDGQFSFGLQKMNILFQSSKKADVNVFMKAQSQKILANMNTFSNGKRQMKLQVHDLKVINCLQDLNSPFRSIIEMNEEGRLAIRIQSHTYELRPYSEIVSWDFYPKLQIHFNPLKFKMTQELYTQIDEFFFGLDKQFETGQDEIAKKNLDKYSMKLPDYYKDLLVDEVKVKIWYRTESRIKRMEGIEIGLQRFHQKEWFVSKKELFDAWVKFVLKQLASQVFSVLGQKIFG